MRAERDAEKDDRKRNRKEDPCERNARESTRKSKSPGSVEHMERKWSEHLLEHKRIFQENTIVGLFRLATEQAPGKAALVTAVAFEPFHEENRIWPCKWIQRDA